MEDRRHIAVMFTDIVGYTTLMGKDEDQAFDMLNRNHTIHITLIKKYNGTLIKEVGDGTFASFSLASDAVRCAMDIQKEAKSQDIPLKIGIHEGEMVMAGNDVLGDGVNVASRLQEISQEGCITISGKVYSDIKNKAGILTTYIGEKKLKNVDESVKVYEVRYEEDDPGPSTQQPALSSRKNKLTYYLIAGMVIVIAFLLIWFNRSKQPAIEIEKSIAVLPFKNDSADPDNEYFCNGMMETILNHLVKVGDLKVMSRTDVEPYRNTSKTREEIASELGVANILEGSVFKTGNRFKISVQLINSVNGFHLWSDAFEGEYTDEIFSVQSTIAKQVAYALKAVITPIEEENIERIPTTDIEAYDYELRGWEMVNDYWRTLDDKYLLIAHNLINRALKIDPGYIRALELKCGIFQAENKLDSVIFYADQLIKLDPDLASGYHYRGAGYSWMGKSDLAVESLKKAWEIQPDNIWINLHLGRLYCDYKQDLKNGLPYLQKALDLEEEPSPDLILNICESFLSMGYYEKAEEYAQKYLEIRVGCQGIQRRTECLIGQGKITQSLQFLDSICDISACEALCYLYKFYVNMSDEKYGAAELYYNKFVEFGDFGENYWSRFVVDSVLLAYMNKELGNKEKALAMIKNYHLSLESQLVENESFKIYINLASIHAIQEDKDKALQYLSEAVNHPHRVSDYDFTQINPYFEDLRDEPEFKAFVKRGMDEKASILAQFKEMKERGEIDL